MVKNGKIVASAGMMRRRVIFSPRKVRKARPYEWIPTMAYPDEEEPRFPEEEDEKKEDEEEGEKAEIFERSGTFSFKELPSEIRDIIYNHALVKRGMNKPALLDALRDLPVLHKAALSIYYQINCFTIGLIQNSPLSLDIESNDALTIMKNIKVHVPHLSPLTQLSTVLYSATNMHHLILTTSSSHSINLVALRYFPSFKNLVSLTIEADNTWCDNRFYVFGFPLGQEHPVNLLNKMLGEEGVGHAVAQDKTIWQWTSQAHAGDDKSSATLPFSIRSPRLRPKCPY